MGGRLEIGRRVVGSAGLMDTSPRYKNPRAMNLDGGGRARSSPGCVSWGKDWDGMRAGGCTIGERRLDWGTTVEPLHLGREDAGDFALKKRARGLVLAPMFAFVTSLLGAGPFASRAEELSLFLA